MDAPATPDDTGRDGHQKPPRADVHETAAASRSAYPVLGIIALVALAGLVMAIFTAAGIGVLLLAMIAFFVALFGLYTVEPNEAAVLTLFGAYRGTDQHPGLRWANPFYQATTVSLRIRNFVTHTAKVNDARGNPIEIAAVVVWRVHNTAEAVFGVDDFVRYVYIQSESAVRHVAREYPYDAYGDHDTVTLVGDPSVVAHQLQQELTDRVGDAGIDIIEARITDLSYAPEVAQSMLRRQQADALVAARTKIVEGATAMVRDAVQQLAAPSDHDDAIEFDADRRMAFASNLMTMIVTDGHSSTAVSTDRSSSSSRAQHAKPKSSRPSTKRQSKMTVGDLFRTVFDAV